LWLDYQFRWDTAALTREMDAVKVSLDWIEQFDQFPEPCSTEDKSVADDFDAPAHGIVLDLDYFEREEN
jgi:hypothetical protein